VRGPATVLLAWDETLEALSLSTGTPKTTSKLLATGFLQIAGNQVSDCVEIVSSDLVKAAITLKYRVSFEGEPGHEAWFQVDNYVKLLCDHARSLLKAAARQQPIRVLRTRIEELVRDTLLGKKGDGPRAGLKFTENGMQVTDVDVLDLEVTDAAVAEMLDQAQLLAIKSAITVAEKESALGDRQRVEEIQRKLLMAEHETKRLQADLEAEREARVHALEEQRLGQRALLLQQKREAELKDVESEGAIKGLKLVARNREVDAEILERDRRQQLDVAFLREQVEAAVKQSQAFSPELIAAVTRLGDAQLLSALSANFGELAAVEGKGLLETAKKFLDFVPQTSLPMLKRAQMAEREGDAE
jgi:Shoulder domain